MRTRIFLFVGLLLLPVVAGANLMNFDSLPPGTLYGTPAGDTPGSYVFSQDGIDAYVHDFWIGGSPFFNFARVEPEFSGPTIFWGNIQILQVNNIAMIFDFPGTGDATFAYLHLGGDLNLSVNGGPILQGPNMASFVASMPAGVTMTVNANPVAGGEEGVVSLTGPISNVRVGGQELWLDDVEGQGDEPLPCDYEVTHEELTAADGPWGDFYGNVPGDLMFVEDGIPVHAENFFVGAFTFFNVCQVDVPGIPGFGFNQVMNINNISNRFDIAALGITVEQVTFEYADLGGTENLAVNGFPVQVGEFTAFVDPAPGVTLSVVTFPIGGGVRAEVTLTGNVQELIVGGQEFFLDNICVDEGLPPEPCDFEVTHETLSVGDAWGAPFATPPGSLIFVEDNIPVYIDQIDLGVGLFYDVCFVDIPAIPGFGDNKVMAVNNVVNRYEIAALGITTQQVTFEFADYGGTENLGVNGFPLQIGDIETFANPAPGVTISVITAPIPFGGIRGLVTLTGDVQDLIVGGQEFFLDNLCVDEGLPPEPCDLEVNHETLAVGDAWGSPFGDLPGDLIFIEDGISVVIGEFDFGGGTSFNFCEVIPAAVFPGFGAGRAMAMNNVVNKYDIGSAAGTVAQVTFEYVDLGGDENLLVNGGPLQIGDLHTFVNPAPGVTISVATFPIPGGLRGEVTLTGDVQVLVVGGQEFAIDEICVVQGGLPPECDHLADHESQPFGMAWGGPFGQIPGDFIFAEDNVRVFLNEFDDGGAMLFNECHIDNAFSPAGDGQVMTINNIGVVYSVVHLSQTTASVSFEFFDGAGIENIAVNGNRYVGQIDALPVNFFPGVTATVTVFTMPGFQYGTVELVGDVQRLLIGGQQFYCDNVCFNMDDMTAAPQELPMASALELQPNIPNPFNPSTTLSFRLAGESHVRLDIYDVAGQVVRTLVDGRRQAGLHQVVWDGRDGEGRAAATGVYFVKVRAENEVRTQKIALIK